MTPNSEFLFRLPSPSAASRPAIYGTLSAEASRRGLFPPSTLTLISTLDTFDKDGKIKDAVSSEYDVVGTVTTIANWLRTTKPRHWTAAIQFPNAPDSLRQLHWLRAVCSELLFGGLVDDKGLWCLHLRGTVHEQCQSDPAGSVADDSLAENEYLNIAVAEGTTMLVQLYTEKRWNA